MLSPALCPSEQATSVLGAASTGSGVSLPLERLPPGQGKTGAPETAALGLQVPPRPASEREGAAHAGAENRSGRPAAVTRGLAEQARFHAPKT